MKSWKIYAIALLGLAYFIAAWFYFNNAENANVALKYMLFLLFPAVIILFADKLKGKG